MLQQLEQNLVSAAMSWAVSYVDAAAETRAEALWRKRLRWWRHTDASTADKSFKRKYPMDQSAFNKLVGILRPVIERDETFARELSYVPLGTILKKCYIPVVKPGREVPGRPQQYMIIPDTWDVVYPWYAIRALKQNSSAVSLDVYCMYTVQGIFLIQQ